MHFRARDILTRRGTASDKVGWLQRATGLNRVARRKSKTQRRREEQRARSKRLSSLTKRQQARQKQNRKAAARREKHRRQIAKASRTLNRRKGLQ